MAENSESTNKDSAAEAAKTEDGQSVLDMQNLDENEQSEEVEAHGNCISVLSVVDKGGN